MKVEVSKQKLRTRIRSENDKIRPLMAFMTCPDCGCRLVPSSGCAFCPCCGWSLCA